MKLTLVFTLFINSILFSQNENQKFDGLRGKVLVDSLLSACDKFRGQDETKAESFAKKALLEAEKCNYHKGELNAMISLINSENHFSRYENAIKLNLKALDFAEKHHFFKEKPLLYNSLASSYLYLNNYKYAIKFFRKTGEEYINQNRRDELGNPFNNIAVCYDNQEILDSALFYYKKAYPYYVKEKNDASMGLWFMNVGDLFRKQNKFKEALEYQFKAEKYLIKTNDLETLLVLYNGMGINFLSQNQSQKALKYLKMAEEIGLKLNSSLELANVYYSYFELYKFDNDTKNQLKYLIKYVDLIENIYTVESAKSITEMQEKYENDKKLKEIEILSKDKKLQDLKISKHESSRNFLVGIILLGLILVLILIFSIRNKNKTNSILIQQKEEIFEQKKIVEEKNKEITDSINYAKRIQSAILPQPKLVKEYFSDSFILYKPKDIVAGDFYWFEVIDHLIFFAAADCTGHGVPGAMVSVVCHNALNRSVKEFALKNPAEILNKTREIVIAEFEKSDEDVKDGMDISLCVLNLNSNILEWSGAHNPLWILRSAYKASSDSEVPEVSAEILETKADKQPIGKFAFATDFTKHSFELQKNDIIYIFTDGFQDQFGGPQSMRGGKKLKLAQMRELFIQNCNKSMEDQRKIIDDSFENWKGDLEQVDDVCIIGVRI
jgi:serine phosphatase RsbU (regulator of sigma subunit)